MAVLNNKLMMILDSGLLFWVILYVLFHMYTIYISNRAALYRNSYLAFSICRHLFCVRF